MNDRLQKAIKHFGFGVIYSDKGMHDHAIADFGEVIKLKPDYADAYIGRGNAYSQKGRHDCAIADFGEAIKLKPDYADAYIVRGNAYSEKGMHDYAMADFGQAIKLKPDYAAAYISRGVAYSEKGRPDCAIADFDKAIKLNPKYVDAYNNRGVAYSQKDRHDCAIADFDEAIKLNPKYAVAYNNRGMTYSKEGRHDCAIADFDKAIKLNPDYAEAYNNRGIDYAEKGMHDHAIADFDKAIKLKPDYAGVYSNRGMTYLRKGKHDRAITDFLEANARDTTLKLVFSFVYLAVKIRDIFEEENAEAFKLYNKLLSAVQTIQKNLFRKPPKDTCSESFAHYTSLNTLKSLTSKGSENAEGCFRLYNAAYMNDPEEGRVFFKIIKKYGGPKDIKDILYENDKDRSPTYIGSFVKIDKDEEDKDQLLLWRTYGKQDGKEAAGSCLIYKRVRFAKHYPSQIGAMQQLQAKQNAKPPLYNVIYCSMKNQKNEEENEGQDRKIKNLPQKLEEKLKELINALNEIVEFIKKQENPKQKNKLKGLACELLDSIRFLFKASHYSEESEVRIIHTYYSQEDVEQESNPIQVDTKQMPPRFYLETPKSFSFDEVILGPMVQRVPEWKRWIKQQKTAVKVRKSAIKFGKIH